MPDNHGLKLDTSGIAVVAKVGVVRVNFDFLEHALHCHCFRVGHGTARTAVSPAVVALIIVPYIFKHKSVRHRFQLKVFGFFRHGV